MIIENEKVNFNTTNVDNLDYWFWKDKPFAKGQAWLDILFSVSDKPKQVLYRDHHYTVEKGQFITSDNILSERWGWSRNKVRSFLNLLEERSYISVKRDNKGTIISINKLDSYGFHSTREGTTPKQEKESEEVQDKEHLKRTDNKESTDVRIQEKGSEKYQQLSLYSDIPGSDK